MTDAKTVGTFKFWRRVTDAWTILFFAGIIYDFFNSNILSNDNTLLALAAIYTASLAIYSAEKEFRRWHDLHSSMHPGEAYAVVWSALIVFLIIGALFNHTYHVPVEVSASYIAVISILAITRESKNFYRKKGKR
jgi:uncharacterized membrane protein YhaH (DUF805 family)